MNRIHLSTGILRREGRLLLVASRYPNQPRALWNLPGGRQEPYELLDQTLRRECREEAGIEIAIERLAYIAESYDISTATHFTNHAFAIRSSDEPRLEAGDAHAVACEWVDERELAGRLEVRVVREPLLAYLAGDVRGYYGYPDAGITIAFND